MRCQCWHATTTQVGVVTGPDRCHHCWWKRCQCHWVKPALCLTKTGMLAQTHWMLNYMLSPVTLGRVQHKYQTFSPPGSHPHQTATRAQVISSKTTGTQGVWSWRGGLLTKEAYPLPAPSKTHLQPDHQNTQEGLWSRAAPDICLQEPETILDCGNYSGWIRSQLHHYMFVLLDWRYCVIL